MLFNVVTSPYKLRTKLVNSLRSSVVAYYAIISIVYLLVLIICVSLLLIY
nr:MAG TPA_asm: hypothetical protein [Caudoviricetes sp.]